MHSQLSLPLYTLRFAKDLSAAPTNQVAGATDIAKCGDFSTFTQQISTNIFCTSFAQSENKFAQREPNFLQREQMSAQKAQKLVQNE